MCFFPLFFFRTNLAQNPEPGPAEEKSRGITPPFSLECFSSCARVAAARIAANYTALRPFVHPMSAGLLRSRPPLSSLCFLHFIAPSSILSESLTITHQSTCLPLSGQSIRSIISMPPPESPTSVCRESLYNGEKNGGKYRNSLSASGEPDARTCVEFVCFFVPAFRASLYKQ